MTRPVDEPSPRRIEPDDPAKIKNDPLCPGAFPNQAIGTGLDPADASTVHCPPRLSRTELPTRWAENCGPSGISILSSAPILTSPGNKNDINRAGLTAACGKVEANYENIPGGHQMLTVVNS